MFREQLVSALQTLLQVPEKCPKYRECPHKSGKSRQILGQSYIVRAVIPASIKDRLKYRAARILLLVSMTKLTMAKKMSFTIWKQSSLFFGGGDRATFTVVAPACILKSLRSNCFFLYA